MIGPHTRATGELLILSLWIGAALLFAASVAPTAFSVLPERALAGAVVGRILPVLFVSGMLAGAVAVAAAIAWTPRSWGRAGSGAVVLAACAAAQFIISPAIDRLRADTGAVLGALPPGDPRFAQFGALHGMSVVALGLAMLAAAAGVLQALLALRQPR